MSWKSVALGEVANVGAGNSAPQDEKLFENGTHNFYRTSDVGRIRYGLISDALDKLNVEGVKGLRLHPKGTILFPKSGASTFLNHRVMLEKEGYVSSHLATIKAIPEKSDDKFLLYFLSTVDAKNLVQDSNYPSLKTSVIDKVIIELPPLATQQRIVAKLNSIFAEIDKATAAAEANAKNAEALFQSYLSNIQAHKSTLGEHVTIKTGKLDSNASVENGKYPFFTCSKDIFSINEYAFDCEAVLLAGNNASGDFNVKHYKGKFNAYQRTYVITIQTEDKLTYRYLYFQLINALKRLKSMSVGSNTKFLKIGMIRDLEFPLPKMDEQIKILGNLSTVELKTDLLKNNYLKKLELSKKLKQSILKQAFNGELIKG